MMTYALAFVLIGAIIYFIFEPLEFYRISLIGLCLVGWGFVLSMLWFIQTAWTV